MTGESFHLDGALKRHTRAIVCGPSGMGKSSALSWRAGAATVLSLADYHLRTLPATSPNSETILLDDVLPIHSDYIAALANGYPETTLLVGSDHEGALPSAIPRLSLQPFNEREITSAAEPWFPPAATGHGGVKLSNPALDRFIEAVKANSRTRLLATFPMNLFLLLQVYTPGAALPTTRSQLYSAYVDARLKLEDDPDFATRSLEGIALSTKRGQVAKDEHLARSYGFLQLRPSGRVGFVHELLQDYLTARALRRTPDARALIEHLAEEDWRQVALFYAGLGEPGEVVETFLQRDDLCFAARALAESNEMPEALLDRVVDPLVDRAWREEDGEAVASLGSLQSPKAVDFFAARLKERDPSARARAARVLGHLSVDRAVEYLLPALRDPNPEVRDQVVASLGQSKSDRVLEPLLVALRGDARVGTVDTRLRCAAARALGNFGSEKAVPALIVDLQLGDEQVRSAAAEALAQIRGQLAIRPLRAIVDSNMPVETRAAAERVLSAMAGD